MAHRAQSKIQQNQCYECSATTVLTQDWLNAALNLLARFPTASYLNCQAVITRYPTSEDAVFAHIHAFKQMAIMTSNPTFVVFLNVTGNCDTWGTLVIPWVCFRMIQSRSDSKAAFHSRQLLRIKLLSLFGLSFLVNKLAEMGRYR